MTQAGNMYSDRGEHHQGRVSAGGRFYLAMRAREAEGYHIEVQVRQAGPDREAAVLPCRLPASQGIPMAIQEQNARPGVANRALSAVAKKAYVAFPEACGAMACRSSGGLWLGGRVPGLQDRSGAVARPCSPTWCQACLTAAAPCGAQGLCSSREVALWRHGWGCVHHQRLQSSWPRGEGDAL